jgi:CDP-diacylglycerol---glycerol-3-phosphate 3-phosphatidyltransferase
VTATQAGSNVFLMHITYLRIALVPVVMALVLAGDRTDHAFVIAAALFVVAALTDFFDGYLARRWRTTTTLGSFLDTTADKFLVAGVLIALVAQGRASPWFAAIIVGRELLILGLRGLVAADGVVIPPSIWGKLKAAVQFVAITLAIVRWERELGPFHVDEWAMGAAAFITMMSAIEYLTRFSGALRTTTTRR